MLGIGLTYLLQIVLFFVVAVLVWQLARSYALGARLLLVVGVLSLYGAAWSVFGSFMGTVPSFLQVAAISFGFLALAERKQG